MYDIENPFGESTATKKFTLEVSAKIGLMYIHDLYYAYASGGTLTYYYQGSIAWIHLSTNDTSAPNSNEWIMSRYGLNNGSYRAWYLYSDGNVQYISLASPLSVRPVFYLTSDVEIIGGTGTLTDPYIIS